MTFIIPAEVHSDDLAFSAAFDALPWFLIASNEEILNLHECGYRGDYAADVVASEFPKPMPKELEVFWTCFDARKCAPKDQEGFEVSVDAYKARAWIIENRPDLMVED